MSSNTDQYSAMELQLNSSIVNPEADEDIEKETKNTLSKYYDLVKTLPLHKGWECTYYNYGKFWSPSFVVADIMAVQDTFKAQPSDLFVITYPKSGTTWIKALVFSIVNRFRFPFDDHHPLVTSSPHQCIPFLELIIHDNNGELISDNDDLSSPRLHSMHIPYSALPLSMLHSNCRIIYLCRDPKDTFVSLWYFLYEIYKDNLEVSLDEAFELFCEGYSVNGPIWEHILEYWMASLQQPDKILFVKYEDLKAEPEKNVRRLAEFVGYPFTEEEVKESVVEDIVKFCSFDKLSKVKANKNGIHNAGLVSFKNSVFFRKGKVGDWMENLTPQMAQKLDNIIEQKLKGSGLTFH